MLDVAKGLTPRITEVSTIVVRIWIDEVRRELKKRNLERSGAFCVSLFGGLDVQVADLGQEFEAALRELLEHIKADLTPRQKRIIDLRMEKQEESELALKLKVSESTIDKEIVSIKKKIVLSMAKISNNNHQPPTTNHQPNNVGGKDQPWGSNTQGSFGSASGSKR